MNPRGGYKQKIKRSRGLISFMQLLPFNACSPSARRHTGRILRRKCFLSLSLGKRKKVVKNVGGEEVLAKEALLS